MISLYYFFCLGVQLRCPEKGIDLFNGAGSNGSDGMKEYSNADMGEWRQKNHKAEERGKRFLQVSWKSCAKRCKESPDCRYWTFFEGD